MGRRTSRGALLVLALLWPAGTVHAQIVAPAGRTLFNRTVMVRSFARLDHFDEGTPGSSVRRLVNPYAVVWGAAPHVAITWVTPLVVVESRFEDDPSRNFRTTGAGDSSAFARHDLLRRNVPGGLTRLSPEIGLKLPTGGAFGNGSWDPIGGLIYSRVRDPHWIVADAQFTYSRTGDGGVREGNQWNYDLAYLFRLLPRSGLGVPSLLLVLELNGESTGLSSVRGVNRRDSGGDILFLSPGVEWVVSNRMVLEFSVPFRAHERLNGSQDGPAWSLIAGLRWLM